MGEGFDRACSHWTRASESNLSWPGQNHELCLKGARMDAGLEKQSTGGGVGYDGYYESGARSGDTFSRCSCQKR